MSLADSWRTLPPLDTGGIARQFSGVLDQILPDFTTIHWSPAREDTIARVLREENARVVDPAHIESKIVGPAEFAWDFRCLESGFMDLVAPFMTHPSGCSHLLLQALEELGITRASSHYLIPIIEYTHYVSLVNDFYNLHPALNQTQPDRFVAAKLTQLKYAAQFLAVYPKHIVLHNLLEVDLPTRNRLHKAMMQFAVSEGSSRGLFLDWARRGLVDVALDHYHQNAAFTMAGYFLGPVTLACILADVPEPVVQQVKRAFSWFGIAAKLELERRVLTGAADAPTEPERSPHFLILSFPGSYLLARRTGQAAEDPTPVPRIHFPDYLAWQEKSRATLRQYPVQKHAVVDSMLDTFEEEMAATGILPGLAGRLAASLRKGGSAQ